MTLNEKSSKHLDTTYPALQGGEIPSSSASIQSREGEQQFSDDVEKANPLDDGEENTSPIFDEKDQTQVTSTPGLNAPPDGGFQAWLAVAGGFCTVFASFGWINCKYNPMTNITFI